MKAVAFQLWSRSARPSAANRIVKTRTPIESSKLVKDKENVSWPSWNTTYAPGVAGFSMTRAKMAGGFRVRNGGTSATPRRTCPRRREETRRPHSVLDFAQRCSGMRSIDGRRCASGRCCASDGDPVPGDEGNGPRTVPARGSSTRTPSASRLPPPRWRRTKVEAAERADRPRRRTPLSSSLSIELPRRTRSRPPASGASCAAKAPNVQQPQGAVKQVGHRSWRPREPDDGLKRVGRGVVQVPLRQEKRERITHKPARVEHEQSQRRCREHAR